MLLGDEPLKQCSQECSYYELHSIISKVQHIIFPKGLSRFALFIFFIFFWLYILAPFNTFCLVGYGAPGTEGHDNIHTYRSRTYVLLPA
jgi:hypothetical protein